MDRDVIATPCQGLGNHGADTLLTTTRYECDTLGLHDCIVERAPQPTYESFARYNSASSWLKQQNVTISGREFVASQSITVSMAIVHASSLGYP